MRRPTKVSIFLSPIILYILGTFLLYTRLLNYDKTKDEMMSFHEHDHRPQNDSSAIAKQARPTERFPKYGTLDFFRQCNYAAYHGNTGNCTIQVEPPRLGNEGISNWIPQVVSAHLLAIQIGCDLHFDYSKSVDIAKILTTPSLFTKQDWNWNVPAKYNCKSDPRCYLITVFTVMADIIPFFGGQEIETPPHYRFTYNTKLGSGYFSPFNANLLETAIPGYRVETGFACSLGWLFHLSTTLSHYEPNLFDTILPILNQQDTLVIAVYIRTGETDVVAKQQEEGKGNATTMHNSHEAYRVQAQAILNCTLHQEQEYLLKNVHFTKVVWFVATDSHDLKQWIVDTYNNTAIKSRQQSIHRHVVTTRARGVHTKSRGGPKTSDFAEAMIDWYLIGESDLVVLDNGGPSFGGTAALRTNRPVYHGLSDKTCVMTKPKFVYSDEKKSRLPQCKHLQSVQKHLSPMCVYLLNATGALK